MAYVIAEPCIGTKDSACVDACPVDCIHPKKDEAGYGEADQLFIDPVECIDCGACVPVCPVSAIYAGDDLPEKWAAYHGEERYALWAVEFAGFCLDERAADGCALCFAGELGVKSLASAEVVEETKARMLSVAADDRALWGKMTAPQMMWHLACSYEVALGERSVGPVKGAPQWLMKWVALRSGLRWPKDLKTTPELDTCDYGGDKCRV